MVLSNNKILLTEADHQRFTFHHDEDPNTKNMLKQFRITYIGLSVVLFAALAVLIFLLTRPYEQGIVITLIILLVLDLCIIFLNYAMYRSSVEKVDRYNHYIEVQIVEKLPIEDFRPKHSNPKNEPVHYYPVRGRDTEKKNYTSICYLTKKEYETFNVGDTIKLCVPADATNT